MDYNRIFSMPSGWPNTIDVTFIKWGRFFYELVFSKLAHLSRFVIEKNLYKGKTYFSEKKQVSTSKNFFRQISQIIKYSHPEDFYFMYGMDVKSDKECKEYVNYRYFMLRRNYLNYLHCPENNSCSLLRNKFYFWQFAKQFNFNVADTLYYYFDGALHDLQSSNMEVVPFDRILSLGDQEFFCKDVIGECGRGVFLVKICNKTILVDNKQLSIEELQRLLGKSSYIFQKRVIQHSEMMRINSSSLNTIRLTTVRSCRTGEIKVWPSALRVGINGKSVDNLSQGGIIIGMDLDSGQLHRFGFQRPEFGGRTEVHPDTRVKYSEFIIPFFKEAKEEAIRFHSLFRDIHSIGWDIAITPDGPLFIEGNDNWEITVSQAANRGLRKEFEKDFF